jgi:hypothetical protein
MLEQIDALKNHYGENATQIVSRAIDLLYRDQLLSNLAENVVDSAGAHDVNEI